MNEQKLPIRILQVMIGDGSYGGIASFLYNYYSHMDHKKVHFDFLYCGENSMQSKMKDPNLQDSVVTAFHLLKFRGNDILTYAKLLIKLKAFFSNNSYDIVHINTAKVSLCACVSYTLRSRAVCIAHSHNSHGVGRNHRFFRQTIKTLLRIPCRKYILRKDNYFFACSREAGENLFGRRMVAAQKVKIVNNAIDISKFVYQPEIRNRIRQTNNFVLGHVGRMAEQKNHIFLIELFYELHQLLPQTELWLIGEGELQDAIHKKVMELGLTERVVFWGRRNDVAELMQAMDIFLLPSLYEGLSIAAVEAQTAGLPTYVSDNISQEHCLTNLIHFLPLKAGPSAWAEKIKKDMETLPNRCDMSSIIKQKGYEIHSAAKWLQNYYIEISN